MKARVKIPPGKRERSLRSSASSDMTEIRVLVASCRRETPRVSRASRSRAPTVREGEPWGISLGVLSMLGNHSTGVKRATQILYDSLQVLVGRHSGPRDEEPNRRDPGGAGASDLRSALHGYSTDCQNRDFLRRMPDLPELIERRQ